MTDERPEPRVPDDGVQERFRRYRATHDHPLRNELVEEHRGLALHLARRYAGRGEPTEDLEQVALVGLVKAVERYDPDHGASFSSFAVPTVTGELKRHFRDQTWAVRVPRRAQERRLEVRATIDRLHQELQRAPTIDDVAADVGLTGDEVLEALETSSVYRARSLSAAPDDDATALEERLGHDPSPEVDRDVLLGQLLDELPDREARILRLRFYEDLTQTEIAGRVGISQMHVSRLLRRTLRGLHERLAAEGIEDLG